MNEVVRRIRLADSAVKSAPIYPADKLSGQGIVICGGGKYFPGAWVLVRILRQLGCVLPIELFYLHDETMPGLWKNLISSYGVTCRECPSAVHLGFMSKPWAIINSGFKDVLFLDADNLPAKDPTYLFDTPEYAKTGTLFWPDLGSFNKTDRVWEIFGVLPTTCRQCETGQLVIDKRRGWAALQLAMHYNYEHEYYYKYQYGDKDTFHMAWRRLRMPFSLVPSAPVISAGLEQKDFNNELLFQHRAGSRKWTTASRMHPQTWHAADCKKYLAELRSLLLPSRGYPAMSPFALRLTRRLLGRGWYNRQFK